jgi:hypothetical protein
MKMVRSQGFTSGHLVTVSRASALGTGYSNSLVTHARDNDFYQRLRQTLELLRTCRSGCKVTRKYSDVTFWSKKKMFLRSVTQFIFFYIK